jgi:hypothetical protein
MEGGKYADILATAFSKSSKALTAEIIKLIHQEREVLFIKSLKNQVALVGLMTSSYYADKIFETHG